MRLMTQCNYAPDKLCTMAVHRRAIVSMNGKCIDFWIPMGILIPPKFSTIYNKI